MSWKIRFNQSTSSLTFLSHFFYSNNELPTSHHTFSSQMKRCKSHSDCPGGAAPFEKKGFCPFSPSFPFSLILSLLLCPVLIFYNTNILIIIILIRLRPPTTDIIIVIIIARTFTSAFLIKALAGSLRCTNGWCGKPQYFQGLSLNKSFNPF